MAFVPSQVQSAAAPPPEEQLPPPTETGFVPQQVQEPAAAPVEQAAPAPAEGTFTPEQSEPTPGPVAGAINAASEKISGWVPDAIEDPVSGWVPDVAAVTTALGQGDLGGAVQPIFDYANRPFEYGSNRQGERAVDPNRGQVPTPGEILQDPSAIYDVVPGFWNTGGPGAWAVDNDIDTWAEQNPQAAADAMAQGGGQAVYETWKASGGLQATPAGVDSPFDDEQYSGSVLDRIRQGAREAGEFGGSVIDSGRQGALTPFLKGMVADIGNDPSAPAQIALAMLSGGAGLGAKLAGGAGMVRTAETLGKLSTGARAINTAADFALDPIPNTIGSALEPAARGIRNLGGALDYSTGSRQARAINRLGESTGEYLAAQRAMTPAAASPPPATSGVRPPAPNGLAAPTPTSQPMGGAPLPSNTLYNPPTTPSAARTLPAGRPDPYSRPMIAGSPSTLTPSPGPTAGPIPRDTLAIRGGVWQTDAGAPVAPSRDIAASMRTTTRRIYDEMMTAPPEQFWDRFDSVSHTADVDLGADGFYARWRGAMRQGLYLTDDWSEARVARQMPGVRLPDGSIDWAEVGRLAQNGDANAKRAMGGKRAHDLYVHRIAGSADPDREVYNMLVTYHLDQHSGRFTGNQYGQQYWKQRGEQIAEVLRDAGYTPSPALINRLASINVGDLVASELAGRTGTATMRGQLLSSNGVMQLHIPGRARPMALTPAMPRIPGTPTTTQRIMNAPPPAPPPPNVAPTPNRHRVTTSFGYLSATKRQALTDRLPDDAIMSADAIPVSLQTEARLGETLRDGFKFNDGKTSTGTVREVIDETARELDQWVDMANDPALQVGPSAKEFDRLSKKFAIDGEVLNAADLAGPQNGWRRDLVVEDILRAAAENAFPKAAKSSVPGMEIYGSFMDMRRRVQLYNYLNIPRFAVQQHVGNTISTAIAGKPRAALGIFTNLRDYPAVFRQLNAPGKQTLFIDDIQRKMGGGNLREITQSNRASLSIDAASGAVEEAAGPFGHMAKLLAPGKTVNAGKINDTITRSEIGLDEIFKGYRTMNKDLARETARWSRKYGLPYSEEQINEVVQRFLNQQRVVIDGNTGKPHTGMFGTTAKYEAVYSAHDLNDFLRAELPKIAPPTSATTPDPLGLLVRRVGADVGNNIKVIQQRSRDEINRVAFEWMPNNLDEFASNFVMFHYWMTRAGGLYVHQMVKNPAAMAAYGRMMDDFQTQIDDLDGPDWLKGWFQFMNTPAGFTVWYSPADLFSTLLTFADWQMDAGESPFDDLTWLGRARNHIPFLLNPALDFVAYAVGAYGPDAQIPDLLGLNRPATMATDLLNLANAQGLLPAWVRAAGIGVDAQGNPVPLQPKKLSELYARVGNGISSALKDVTGLRPVPIPNTAASQQRSIAYILEQNFRTDYPGLPQEDIDRKVTDALADPGSSEYQRAWRTQADMPYIMGDTPLPGWAEGAIRQVISPIGMYAGTEQQFLDSTMKGLEPTGSVPPRNLPEYTMADGTVLTAADIGPLEQSGELADLVAADPAMGEWVKEVGWANNAAKFGASKTVDGRVLAEQLSGYYDAGDPAINAVKSASNSIYFGNATEPVSVGGVIYQPDEIAAMDEDTRKALANQYRDENGVTWDMIEQNDLARDAYLDANPNVAAYMDWKNGAYDHPGGEVGYIQQMMAENPAYADYIYRNNYDLQGGAVDFDHALGTDAFLASQGIAPTLYEPISSPTMEPLPAPRNQTITPTVALDVYPGPDAGMEPFAQVDTGFPMTLVEMQGDWAKVTVGGQEGYVDAAYLQNVAGGYQPEGITGVLGGLTEGIKSAGRGLGSVPAKLSDIRGIPLPDLLTGQPEAPRVPSNADDLTVVQDTTYGLAPWVDGGMPVDMVNAFIPDGSGYIGWDFRDPTGADFYGNYFTPDTGGHGDEHPGTDIWGEYGTPVATPVRGTVVCTASGSGESGVNGFGCAAFDDTDTGGTGKVEIQIEGKPQSLIFGHMETTDVAYGQLVDPGVVLGGMGGMSGIAHIHVEARLWNPDGTYTIVDPTLMLSGYYG